MKERNGKEKGIVRTKGGMRMLGMMVTGRIKEGQQRGRDNGIWELIKGQTADIGVNRERRGGKEILFFKGRKKERLDRGKKERG